MRVLMTTTGFPGHFLPLVPFARALIGDEHDVYVAGPRAAEQTVERAGLAFLRCGDLPAADAERMVAAAARSSPQAGHARIVTEGFAGIAARTLLPDVFGIVASWQPDAIVHESHEYAGPLAAETHGIPHARVALGLSSTEDETLELVADALDDLGLPVERLRASPLLTLLPPSFDDGPASHRFRSPRGAAVPRRADDPLVYVTFGSMAATLGYFPGFYAAVIDALADVPARVLVTTGGDGIAPVPPNVQVVRWMPQEAVLAGADLVVSHGGYGTLLGALAYGLPQVVVPLFAHDQWRNARRVAELGAGVVLDGPPRAMFEHPGPDVLTGLPAAVEHVLRQRRYADAARRLADEMQTLPPLADVVAALQPEVIA